MTRFFNMIRRVVRRRIDWLHIPVPRPHGDEPYFAPLQDLDRANLELDGQPESKNTSLRS
jgi:hypothetical protein